MSRKQQAEVDKVLRKVSSGVSAFEDALEAVQEHDRVQKEQAAKLLKEKERERDRDKVNQKEKVDNAVVKLEAEMKQNIKKLQRYRDSMRDWISGNEIKSSKEKLEESTKRIEKVTQNVLVTLLRSA